MKDNIMKINIQANKMEIELYRHGKYIICDMMIMKIN